jgi:hypothetical protein
MTVSYYRPYVFVVKLVEFHCVNLYCDILSLNTIVSEIVTTVSEENATFIFRVEEFYRMNLLPVYVFRMV